MPGGAHAWPRRGLAVILALLLLVGVELSAARAQPAPSDEDATIALSLAEMLRDARTIISNNQERINDPALGDKGLTGQVEIGRAHV